VTELAPIYKRVLAFTLDLLIVWGGLTAVNFIVFISLPMKISDPIGTMSVLAMLGYVFIKDGTRGQSVGKRIMKIRVVKESNNSPISHELSFVRAIPLLLMLPLDIIFCLGGKRKRLGDIFAGTKVVQVNA
jgi:uncharacterized RDD family membrane protein YckC